MSRWNKPIPYLQDKVDELQAQIEELKQEIQLLSETKADRRGRKPKETEAA